MKTMHRAFYTKPLALYLIAALVAMSTFAGPAEAMFLAAAPADTAPAGTSLDRAADLLKVRTALESRVVTRKLADYGLSAAEIEARMNGLTDQQLHELATHTDSIQAGGDPADFFFGLLIVALLAVVLVYLIEGRIEIRSK